MAVTPWSNHVHAAVQKCSPSVERLHVIIALHKGKQLIVKVGVDDQEWNLAERL